MSWSRRMGKGDNAMKAKSKKKAEYVCLDCGKLYYKSSKAKIAASIGCYKCGSVDIDLYVEEKKAA